MRLADVAARRLRTQHIRSTSFTRSAEVVSWLGAVQAQDYLGALWAVGLRMASAVEADVERALADRSIVRTWPMRGTLHFVAAEDARWLVDLVCPTVLAATARRLRHMGLDEPTIARARRAVEKRLAGGRSLTRPALYQLLEQAGIAGAAQRGLHVLWRLAHDRVLCFGPREGKQQTLVLFDEWLPRARPRPRDESLAELAMRYFTGHGPATVRDFAWWSGLRASDVRAAMHLVDGKLEKATVDGHVHLFGAGAAPRRAPARGRVFLLPPFDELIVGYTDRRAVLDAGRNAHVNTGWGLLNATIVVDGRIAGTWKRTLERGRLVLRPSVFEPLDAAAERGLAREVERYAAFLGLPAR